MIATQTNKPKQDRTCLHASAPKKDQVQNPK